MTLGERIYKLRTEKEMSQGDLADPLEVSRQSISKWETNGSVPELDKLVQEVCGFEPMAAQIVHSLKDRGYRVVLATNPLFPAIATQNRIRWAGLQPEDFEYITTYENSHYCKPNPDYYREILEQLHLQPEECLMVGNDVSEDMVTQQLGMKVFLLTDCLINKASTDISRYPHGGFSELESFLNNL